MDRRVLVGLAASLAGLAAGVATALADAPELGLVAGGFALAAGAATLSIAAGVHRAVADAGALRAQLDAARAESDQLQQAATVGREAMRVAGTFAEMVAMRNLELARLAGSGGLLDEPTGLLDARYFQAALNSRVAAARRLLRPVTLVLLQLDRAGIEGTVEGDARVAAFAAVIRRTLREADTACRLDDTTFGLILEDTPEGGGVWVAERVRASLAREGGAADRIAAGVAAYPSHALDADVLQSRARAALERARANGQGEVEVAPVE